MANTKRCLHVLHDTAAYGGPLAQGYYARGVVPAHVATHLVSIGRARWEEAPQGATVHQERREPKPVRDRMTLIKPDAAPSDPTPPEAA